MWLCGLSPNMDLLLMRMWETISLFFSRVGCLYIFVSSGCFTYHTSQAPMGRSPIHMSGAANYMLWVVNLHRVPMRKPASWILLSSGVILNVKSTSASIKMSSVHIAVTTDQLPFEQMLLIDIEFNSNHLLFTDMNQILEIYIFNRKSLHFILEWIGIIYYWS